MIYAIQVGDTKTIVGAAETVALYEEAVSKMLADPKYTTSVEQIDVADMMSEAQWRGFEREPVVVVHQTPAHQRQFALRHSLSLLADQRELADRNRRMLVAETGPDPWLTETRTARELLYPDGVDPNDARSPEQREKDASKRAIQMATQAMLDAAEREAQAKPKSDPPTDPTVSQIDTFKMDDQPEQVRAALIQASPNGSGDQAVVDTSDSLEIDPDGSIAVFHKVEVDGLNDGSLSLTLAMDGLDLHAHAVLIRNTGTGVWAAFQTQASAEEVMRLLRESGMVARLTAVDDHGVPIRQEAGERLARPWGAKAAEFAAMSRDEQEAVLLSVRCEEFIFCGVSGEGRDQHTVFIVPAEHFAAAEEGWDRPLGIGHLLPGFMTETGPGRYQTKGTPWATVSYALHTLGMVESALLRMHVNAL